MDLQTLKSKLVSIGYNPVDAKDLALLLLNEIGYQDIFSDIYLSQETRKLVYELENAGFVKSYIDEIEHPITGMNWRVPYFEFVDKEERVRENLSREEREILDLILNGMTHKEALSFYFSGDLESVLNSLEEKGYLEVEGEIVNFSFYNYLYDVLKRGDDLTYKEFTDRFGKLITYNEYRELKANVKIDLVKEEIKRNPKVTKRYVERKYRISLSKHGVTLNGLKAELGYEVKNVTNEDIIYYCKLYLVRHGKMPSRDELRKALKVDIYDRGLSMEKIFTIIRESGYSPKAREVPWEIQEKVIIKLLRENGAMDRKNLLKEANEIIYQEYGKEIGKDILSILCRKGKIKRLERGIYTI